VATIQSEGDTGMTSAGLAPGNPPGAFAVDGFFAAETMQ
jgi:hypothetical protein